MALRFGVKASAALLLTYVAGALNCAVAQNVHVTAHRGAYATNQYRNLLLEAGHSHAEVDTRISNTFDQLFHGDPQTQAVYYPAGSNANGPLAYVADVGNHDVRSEGMSYGMMIAVQTNHKAEFDAIWNWANTSMLITDPANPSCGYFAWSMNFDGSPNSDGPAPDGEEYFAMSLYFAEHRWGNGTGIYEYHAQADRILSVMRHHPLLTGAPPFRIHPGDTPFSSTRHVESSSVGPMLNETYQMIVFAPGGGGKDFTDPSYHLPAFYQLWALWAPKADRSFWAKAAETSRRFFLLATNSQTGLAPDYANFDGTPHATSYNPDSDHYASDSWRTISNWSVDQSWWAANTDARVLSDRLQHFLASRGMSTFVNRYTLEGTPLSKDHSIGMLSATAIGGLAASNTPEARAFVDQLWNTPIPTGEQRYYDGMLYMFALLHTSGEFKIWKPSSSDERHRALEVK